MLAALAEAGRRVELRVVPTSAPLLEQILAADCVLTVSSSGAAVAHAFGRHAGVIWLPEIEAHHGPPPGWVAAVLRRADELARFLSDAPETRLPPREELESWVQALENRVADRFP